MSIESLVAIISLATAIVGLVTALIIAVLKLKKAFGELTTNGNWKKLLQVIYQAMVDAESTGATGESKQEMVLAAVDSFAKSMGISYEVDQVKEAIEEVIALSKKINIKKK